MVKRILPPVAHGWKAAVAAPVPDVSAERGSTNLECVDGCNPRVAQLQMAESRDVTVLLTLDAFGKPVQMLEPAGRETGKARRGV
jgi:hypothetical protein